MTAPRLGYVVRFVTDLDASVAFYHQVLGQTLTKRAEHWAQFDAGSIRLGLYLRSAMASELGLDEAELGAAPGAFELAFEVEECDRAHRAALAAGARELRPPADRSWGERTAYLLDPDGAVVELYHRISGDAEADLRSVELGADLASAAHRREMSRPASDEAAGLPDPTP